MMHGMGTTNRQQPENDAVAHHLVASAAAGMAWGATRTGACGKSDPARSNSRRSKPRVDLIAEMGGSKASKPQRQEWTRKNRQDDGTRIYP
eukprot:417522-Amphidinium_carterae.1